MKFLLVFSICSAISGSCGSPIELAVKHNSWSECVNAGGVLIQDFSVKMKESIDIDKLYLSYFCNEIKIDEPA